MFVDETGADLRNAIRRYGYSIRGKPLTSRKLCSHEEKESQPSRAYLFQAYWM